MKNLPTNNFSVWSKRAGARKKALKSGHGQFTSVRKRGIFEKMNLFPFIIHHSKKKIAHTRTNQDKPSQRIESEMHTICSVNWCCAFWNQNDSISMCNWKCPVRLNGGAFISLSEHTMLHNTLVVRIFIVMWYQNANDGTMYNRRTAAMCTSLGNTRYESIRYYAISQSQLTTISIGIPNWSSEHNTNLEMGHWLVSLNIQLLWTFSMFMIHVQWELDAQLMLNRWEFSFRDILSCQFTKQLNKYSASRSQFSMPLKCINISWQIPKTLQIGKFQGHWLQIKIKISSDLIDAEKHAL